MNVGNFYFLRVQTKFYVLDHTEILSLGTRNVHFYSHSSVRRGC